MLREEWRLHAELFGGRRFVGFPLVIGLLAGGGFVLLGATGTPAGAVVAGVHLLVGFFGLQVGTIGLIGRDAMRNVLGDVTLLVFTSRTLPVSWRRLLATFLLKDLLYYSAFVLAPLAIAYTPLALAEGTSPDRVALLWLTLTGTFGLGVGLSLTLAALATRDGRMLLAVVAAAALAVVVLPVDVVAWTPYRTYAKPSLQTLVTGFAPTVAFALAGPLLFTPAGETTRRRGSRRRWLWPLLPDGHGVATRALLDVARSSGSVTKVLFSMGVLVGVSGVLLQTVATTAGITFAPGIAFGTLLGLGGFTTYAWITQFDDPREYLRYPISMRAVFRGKLVGYLALTVPAGVLYLLVAAYWYPIESLAAGALVQPLVALYVFGVTAVVAGLSPTELLFDTPRFAAFGAAIAVVAVPLLVAALVSPMYPVWGGGAVAVAVLAGVAGVVLLRCAGPRWERQLRA
jgi:hypothetical protein